MSAVAIAPALGSRPLAQSRMRGALRPTKLSAMNRLNAAPRPTPLKRSIVYNSDEENIAPSFSKLDSTKRKRAFEDDDHLFESPKAVKTNRTSSASDVNKTVEVPTARKMSVTIEKPAGRAPLGKSTKAFGRRSQRTPLGRLTQAPAAPTIKSLAPQSTRQPASWSFDIHVDTPDEEASNTMQHFAGRLDISDDDEAKAKADDRGKENIPPHELGIAMPPAAQPLMSTSRHGKNMMAPSRSPLVELKASDYYPADLKGLFNTIVVDDGSSTPTEPQGLSKEPTASPDFANTEAEPTFVAESDSVVKNALI